MNLQVAKVWEIAAGVTLIAGAAWLGRRMSRRKRPSAMEVEFARRMYLTDAGRVVDGNLLDVREIPSEEGQTLTMLLYEYRIGGAEYECSQNITDMGSIVDPELIRAGFPCSVRYQPGNPQNSIVVAENWSGLRVRIPLFPVFAMRESTEASPDLPKTDHSG